MKLKTLVPAALLFLLPWMVFAVCCTPGIAEHVAGAVLVGVGGLMMVSPLLTALYVRHVQANAGTSARRLTMLVGLAAVLVNSPVILLVLFVSLHRAAP